MRKQNLLSSFFSIVSYSFQWMALTIPAAAVTGSLVALFLWLLDRVTQIRWQHEWLLFLLPLAGILIHLLYSHYGKDSVKGNNLIIDEIHEPGGGIPKRMAPLVLLGTLITHLFGGSAGREGTAVQMGGSISGMFNSWYKPSARGRQVLLTTGIAAGFGAVFGTPAAGAVFAIEVLTIGKIKYDALLPCVVASITGHLVCTAWGIHHTPYHIAPGNSIAPLHIDPLLLLKTIPAAIAFGLTGLFFAITAHGLKKQFNRFIRNEYLVPVAGGVIIIALTYLVGTTDYNGLGVSSKQANGISIVNAFHINGVNTWSWFWKLLFTTITLSSGFKGGEVTPLFFIGATLGNTLAVIMNAPVDLFAALGFIAVFAGATNTPIACTIMGVELFGSEYILYFAIACCIAYCFSGHSGIYSSQRIGSPKTLNRYFSKEPSLRQSIVRVQSYIQRALQKITEKKP